VCRGVIHDRCHYRHHCHFHCSLEMGEGLLVTVVRWGFTSVGRVEYARSPTPPREKGHLEQMEPSRVSQPHLLQYSHGCDARYMHSGKNVRCKPETTADKQLVWVELTDTCWEYSLVKQCFL
jgi:hypothetical protein